MKFHMCLMYYFACRRRINLAPNNEPNASVNSPPGPVWVVWFTWTWPSPEPWRVVVPVKEGLAAITWLPWSLRFSLLSIP